MARRLIFFLCVGVATSTIVKYEPSWHYDDETKWPGYHCQAGGKRQSPIDIKTQNVITDVHRRFIKYGPLKFIGYKRVLVTGINNGYTIQFSSEGEEAIHPVLTGGPLKHQYRLEQMHFHWVSEHSINGIKFPMEIHFVHVRTDMTVMEALGKKDGLAIVAVFCNIQSSVDEPLHGASLEVMQYIPNLLHTGDRISGVLMDMTKLLSPNENTYYTYAGSLTSPECNEAVIWIIFESPIYISDDQYRMFSKIGVSRHNFRSLQRLSSHMVFTPAPRYDLTKPKLVVFIEDVFKAFTAFFNNITTYIQKGLRAR